LKKWRKRNRNNIQSTDKLFYKFHSRHILHFCPFLLTFTDARSNYLKTNKKKSLLSGIPPWGLAGLTFIASIMLFFVIGDLGGLLNINEDIGEPILYIIYGIFIAVCCFFIVRKDPESIWFVPIICNALGILIAITSTKFWIKSEWIYLCIGWLLTIIASVIGYRIGKSSE
jgi:hypothetical protein